MTENILFRKEAQEAQKRRLEGDVLVSTNVSYWFTTTLMLATVIALISFLTLGTYTPRTKALGELKPTSGLTKVYPSRRGVIARLMVTEGDIVAKGDALLELSYERIMASGENVGTQLKTRIEENISSLEKLMDEERQRLTFAIEIIESKIKKKSFELKDIRVKLERNAHVLRVAQEELKALERLEEKKYVAKSSVNAKRIEVDQAKTEQQSLQLAEQGNFADTRSLSIERQLQEKDSRLKREQLNQKQNELHKQLIELASTQSEIIKAPVGGKVTALLGTKGTVIEPTRPILTLLPSGARLEAEVYIPAAAVGFIRKGQHVNVKLSSFPYQKYGTFEGQITEVSDYTISPGDLGTSSSLRQAVFRLRVSLAKQHVATPTDVYPLLPGMVAELDIIGEKLSILDWLFEPIVDVTKRF